MIYAAAKPGELLKAIPKAGKTREHGSLGGTILSLPSGITKVMSHQAQGGRGRRSRKTAFPPSSFVTFCDNLRQKTFKNLKNFKIYLKHKPNKVK